MDDVVGWVLDVSLSKQETYAILGYFVPHDWSTWLLFLNPPLKFEFDMVKNAADMWVLDVSLFEQ
jgi:hypothetical protein